MSVCIKSTSLFEEKGHLEAIHGRCYSCSTIHQLMWSALNSMTYGFIRSPLAWEMSLTHKVHSFQMRLAFKR